MTDAHHHAAGDDQRCRGEPELICSQQGGNDDVTAGLELAVNLHDDPVTEVVHQEGLLRLGQPQFPGCAGVLDGCQG